MKKVGMQTNKRTKLNSGITLIALVVTIVVLLILAGITINMLFSENGIITKAQEAAEKTDKAQKDETAGMKNVVEQMEQLINQGKNENKRIINVKATQTEGENLWNNIVTLNISLEDIELSLSQEQKKTLAAYMLDYSSYDELIENIENLVGSGATIEEIITDFGFNSEAQFIDKIIDVMKKGLNYNDIDKLENLGVPVITVTTPYETKLYTDLLNDNELKCGFVENGEYTFTVQSGNSTVTETIKISNIRKYDTEVPHDVIIEGNYCSPDWLSYAEDDSIEYGAMPTEAININNSITLKTQDRGGALSYVIKNKEYFKNFSDDNEWMFWHGYWNCKVWYTMAVTNLENMLSKETLQTLTSRQIMFFTALTNSTLAQVLTFEFSNGEWYNFLDDYLVKQYRGETVNEEEIAAKYPKSIIGNDIVFNGIFNDGIEESTTINFLEDTNIFIYLESSEF